MANPRNVLWLAQADSRNFSFEAFGRTEADALALMRRGLEHHSATMKAAAGWVEEMMRDIQTRPCHPGFYRDRERIL